MNITAIIMVIISTLFAAYYIIQKEISHCRMLDLTIRFIGTVSSKALYYDQPFSDIMFDIKNEDCYKNFPVVCKFCSFINDGYSVPDAWKNASLSMSGELNPEEYRILMQYGEEMCSCNKEDIPDISARVLSEFQEYRQQAVENRKLRSRSTAAVTVSLGAVFVLIFA